MNWNFWAWVKPLCDSNNDYLLHICLSRLLYTMTWKIPLQIYILNTKNPAQLQIHFGRSLLFVFFPQSAKLSPEGRQGRRTDAQALACPHHAHCQHVLSVPGHATKEQQGTIPWLLGLLEAQSDTDLDGWLGQLLQGRALRQTANKGASLPTRCLATTSLSFQQQSCQNRVQLGFNLKLELR